MLFCKDKSAKGDETHHIEKKPKGINASDKGIKTLEYSLQQIFSVQKNKKRQNYNNGKSHHIGQKTLAPDKQLYQIREIIYKHKSRADNNNYIENFIVFFHLCLPKTDCGNILTQLKVFVNKVIDKDFVLVYNLTYKRKVSIYCGGSFFIFVIHKIRGVHNIKCAHCGIYSAYCKRCSVA